MSVRPFLRWPDRRLRSAAAPVGAVTDAHRAIWDDLVDTMEAMGAMGHGSGPGLGLAAPQVGVMLRLAVVDASAERGRAIRLADPEIVDASDEVRAMPEASPNLPGAHARVTRPARVIVAFTDRHGMRVRQEFTDLWATSVQHQIDHLDGRLYVDRLGPVKRDLLLRKVGKAR